MTWGFMSTAHLVSLAVAVVIVVLFSIIVSKLNKKKTSYKNLSFNCFPF